MDYALKCKLVDKRRELIQKARKAINDKKTSTSNSIITTKRSFNFNDVIKAEKEQYSRNNFLMNKLSKRKNNNFPEICEQIPSYFTVSREEYPQPLKDDSINEPTEQSEGEIEKMDNIYVSTQPLADEMSFNILKPIIIQ